MRQYRNPFSNTTPIYLAFSIYIFPPSGALANDDQTNGSLDAGTKAVVSIEALDSCAPGKEFSLGTASEYADRNGQNPDQAIMLCCKALEKNDDDIDLHLHYAELLEQKFIEEGKTDSTLYMKFIKEWLIVVRNEAGDERGLTFHGIGLPLTGMFYNDENRVILARKHLLTLTGVTPKGWETDGQYLQKVSRLYSVSSKILPKDTQNPNQRKKDIPM
jgi:hypothetical protein